METNKNILKRYLHLLIWNLGLFINKWSNRGDSGGILIVKTDLIGDFVLFLPALEYLRNKYAGKKIHIVVQRSVLGLASTCPYVDEAIEFNKNVYKRRIDDKLKLLFRIRRGHYQTAINAVYSRDRFSDEITLWANAEETIGWNTLTPDLFAEEKTRGDRIYSRFLDSGEIKKDTHELLKNRELVRLLGISVGEFYPSISITEEQRIFGQRLLDGADIAGRIVIGIVPDAKDKYREWGNSKYGKLIDRIREGFGGTTAFVIIGSNPEAPLTVTDKPDTSPVIDLRGKTSVAALPAILAKCDLVVGNETGPIHLANALGIHSICILGGGHYERFVPYPSEVGSRNHLIPVCHMMDCFKCNWNCIYEEQVDGTFPCIGNISVDQVYEAVRNELRKPLNSPS